MCHLFAYFDPGSGSMLMQALVGGTAGLWVFGKYLWNTTFTKSRSLPRVQVATESTLRSSRSSGEIPIPSFN